MNAEPRTTICVLTYADYPDLAKRVLGSISRHVRRSHYRMVVGANAVSPATMKVLEAARDRGEIDRLVVSETNLGKCPMARRMFEEIETEFIWWFDDDTEITSERALAHLLRLADVSPASVVQWGEIHFCTDKDAFCHDDPVRFVRSAPWYRGLPPPSWQPGGKGEFNFEGKGTGDGRWFFALGGTWLARTSALVEMDWPDRRLRTFGEDVFLGEAIRQQGWEIGGVRKTGVACRDTPRRWNPEDETPLAHR